MFAYPRQDILAGVVVFLVALPLCLGIAIACDAPPISGLVSGAVGGLVASLISRSPLSVSGPAAGLTAIVLTQVQVLGSFELFLTATILAGGLQFVLGGLRAGRFATLVPSAVIKGMLAAIGITIILKQIPVAVGVDGGLHDVLGHVHPGALALTAVSLIILFGWRYTPLARIGVLSPALVVVLVASGMAAAFGADPELRLPDTGYVSVPLGGIDGLMHSIPRPDFAGFTMPAVWITAATVAVVASIETLLSLQAVDRIDPLRRSSPADRELLAQGVSNAASGFFGGLPVTAVILRSGVNVAAGGRERLSAFVHGLLLVSAVVFAATLLNRIPLACLAAVLIQVGFSLCRPALFTAQVRLGWTQVAPFAITMAAVLLYDLLTGVIIGIIVGVAYVLYQNSQDALAKSVEPNGAILLRFRRDGTFLSKPGIEAELDRVPGGSRVIIDGAGEYIDQDVKELLAHFLDEAPRRDILVTVNGIDLSNVTFH